MAASLDGALAKVAWAQRHLHELEAEIAQAPGYLDSIGFAQEFHADTSTIEVTLQGIQELPVAWSLLAADYVQNLRCALNYLAWELSRWNLERQGLQREPNAQTQFPICTHPRQFDAWRLPDVHPDHVARIEKLQPNGADHLMEMPDVMLRNFPVEVMAQRHVLGILVELTNQDKHRLLPGVLVNAQESFMGSCHPIDCVMVTNNFFVQDALKNGAKWAEFKVTPTGTSEPKMQVDDRIVPDIRFGGYSVTGVLPQVGQAVGHMIQSFAPVF